VEQAARCRARPGATVRVAVGRVVILDDVAQQVEECGGGNVENKGHRHRQVVELRAIAGGGVLGDRAPGRAARLLLHGWRSHGDRFLARHGVAGLVLEGAASAGDGSDEGEGNSLEHFYRLLGGRTPSPYLWTQPAPSDGKAS